MLHKALDVNIEFVDIIVKVCCILHNCVRRHDGIKLSDTAHECPLESLSDSPESRTMSAAHVRTYFATYFTSPQEFHSMAA
jgi:hypothetical protein